MGELFRKSLSYIKANPRVLFSIALIFLIPIVLLLHTYLIVNQFEDNLKQVVRSKAVLAEDIVKFVAKDIILQPQELEKLISDTKQLNEEVGGFEFINYDKVKEEYRIIASDNEARNDLKLVEGSDTFFYREAWNNPEDNLSYITSDEKGRHLNIVEAVKDAEGERVGLVFMSFPLAEFDKINKNTELRAYIILLIIIVIILLLMANNVRLFSNALMLNKLREVDKMKDTFVSMASHELKAPLVSMKGNVEILTEEKGKNLDDETRHYLENIDESADRLAMLVNDILEVSRLEGNRIPINISEIDPLPVIEKSIEEIKPQAVQKNLNLEFAGRNLPRIKADPDRLKQILINLLSNSVKYTLKGKVEMQVSSDDKTLDITVADTGVGISADGQEKLFKKFSRVYDERTNKVGGTGLGLWISRELARKMNGDITVESIKNVGSHFTLKLPVVK